jgi:sarcosine oxidase subunit gamma
LPNRAEQQDNGLLVSQLSFDEYLLLDTTPAASAMITTLCNSGSLDEAPDCYQVPRQDSHGCLAVTGQAAWRTLAALISVDLRPHRFVNFQIAQTLLNELSVIVIRCDQSFVPNYYLLVDITSIEFLWTVLLDAMAEAGGAPVGLNAFQTLEAAMDSGEASLVLG